MGSSESPPHPTPICVRTTGFFSGWGYGRLCFFSFSRTPAPNWRDTLWARGLPSDGSQAPRAGLWLLAPDILLEDRPVGRRAFCRCKCRGSLPEGFCPAPCVPFDQVAEVCRESAMESK